jgi:uncharacterized protein YraI
MSTWARLSGYAVVASALVVGGLAERAQAETVEVTGGSLNVRSGPGTGYRVLFVTHRGDRHDVLSRRGNWVQLRSAGRTGWGYGSYLRVVSTAPTPAAPAAPAAPAPGNMGELYAVRTSRLNARSGPSTRYRILRTLQRGFRLRATGSRGNWRSFQLGAERAWVYGPYLSRVGPATAPPPPAPTPAPRPPLVGGTADQQLARLQLSALESARRELARGVVEAPLRSNRGPRVNDYASSAGIRTGVAWCGNFLAWNYTQAAKQSSLSFSGQRRLHSVGKTRHYFLYRNYTVRATRAKVAEWEALRRAHQAQGSTRRYFTLRGSVGDRAAGSLPHEVFGSYQSLPLRPGDTVIWSRGGGHGHLGMVERYDPVTGRLTTIEGNRRDRVGRYVYDLRSSTIRNRIEGFARPARGDFR